MDIENNESEKFQKVNTKAKRKSLKELRKNANILLKNGNSIMKNEDSEIQLEVEGEEDWGGIKLHVLLKNALVSLNFNVPTPIQIAAIPVVATGKCDLVGAAETGSGKTLAFGLPVIDFLLKNWAEYSNRLSPVALIIAPTRELALQITTVLKEVSAPFKSVRKIEIVVVVGGFSEHKQRRLLTGGSGMDMHVFMSVYMYVCVFRYVLSYIVSVHVYVYVYKNYTCIYI
jgi:ATP-dependent RNA helicase DDX24/MAK5